MEGTFSSDKPGTKSWTNSAFLVIVIILLEIGY